LDHVIVLNETGLRRILKSYFDYYERTRTHLSLDKDAPISRPAQRPEIGRIVDPGRWIASSLRANRRLMGTRFPAQPSIAFPACVPKRGQRTDSCGSQSSLAIEEASAPFDLHEWSFVGSRG
jgi:hypothetical protein